MSLSEVFSNKQKLVNCWMQTADNQQVMEVLYMGLEKLKKSLWVCGWCSWSDKEAVLQLYTRSDRSFHFL